ncbi:F-box/kelch-repeat protein At3g06240-like [Gastrolobium bilobum]|uniref:F-box/kelch-repeat protein At3g06240-like n=1 Tax=Gastrolobium bilobum TaxID=150636 RepID=UPI002AB0C537|nr:F-box/kelch-repeat protein At3g06240-like [Gastrolobium bilobum]
MGTRCSHAYYEDEFSLCSSFSSFQRIENIKHSLPIEADSFCAGAVNGVVCLYNHDDLYRNITYNIILWNPLIDRHLKLPTPLFSYEEFSYFHEVRLGFGFDSKKNDFKVVRIFSYLEGLLLLPKVELYSLNEGAWRVIDYDASHGLLRQDILDTTPCFFNGNVHWISYDKYGIYDYLLIFNMVEEKFKRMELPDEVNECTFLDVSVMKIVSLL